MAASNRWHAPLAEPTIRSISMRRSILKLLAVVSVFGGVFAMAASLGGISSASLGADDAAVASCDTDGVTTSYTSGWSASDERYDVSAVTVGGVDDGCDGRTVKVTLIDSSGASLAEGTLSMPTSAATSHTVTLSSTPSAKSVTGVHVTIA
jgi:hypothetical protein